MTILQGDIIGKIRTAIDDIAPSVADSFVTDVNSELWQAVEHASMELSMELPINLLDVSTENLNGTGTTIGCSLAKLPDDYLRFVSLGITGCSSIVRELMEPGSDEEKMQRSTWSMGTASKPKAMLDHTVNGKSIVWWPGGSSHNTAELRFIEVPTVVNQVTAEVQSVPAIVCAIRPEAERLVIYRAASIFFEGKKEETIAEKFQSLSTNY